MTQYEIDLYIYEKAFAPEDARIFAGLLGLARRQDVRLRSEGHPGLFANYTNQAMAEKSPEGN